MGTDIHTFIEVRDEQGEWHEEDVFGPGGFFNEIRNYALFTFLGGVRRVWGIPVLADPRGLPEDVTRRVAGLLAEDYGGGGYHSVSWLTLAELLSQDYDVMVPSYYGGDDELVPLRDNFPDLFFEHLDALKAIGDPAAVRVVFGFDS